MKKNSKFKKLFQIVIPKSCPHCGKRTLKKDKGTIKCDSCGTVIETEVESKHWFFSSQDRSIPVDLKKEVVERKKRIRERLFELQNMRKLL